MKVEIECLPCLIHRGYQEINKATQDPALQFKAVSAFLEFMAQEFNSEAVSAVLGTSRYRIIKRITGNADIYAEKKRISNSAALNLLPALEGMIARETSSENRFRKACLAGIVGNIIEFDIPEHHVSLEELHELIESAEADLVIDDISPISKEAKKAKTILFLVDNAGEIALDKLLVEELKQMGAYVTVVVKRGPVLNDATLEDAKEVGMHEIADAIITTGTDAVGLPLPNERSKELTAAYSKADLVIAKGMGYAETLTELMLQQPHAFLLRTKCNPVAKHFGVPRGKNVAKLVMPCAHPPFCKEASL